jgi:IS1 family transposase
MANNLTCPRCQLSHIKKNGHTYYGKQNYRCKRCGRQFVADSQLIGQSKRNLVEKLLLERISLSGICRVLDISLTWLLDFIEQLYADSDKQLNFSQVELSGELEIICLEADELWSFVQNKENKQWIWLVIDKFSKQIIAAEIGDHSEESARKLFEQIPDAIKENAIFYTDLWKAYGEVIPAEQHITCEKGSGLTNTIERFNCTLRQRVSRLVRKSLSFSKKQENHEGAIRYFICHYNKIRQAEFQT